MVILEVILSFLKAYWKPIALALIVLAAVWSVHSAITNYGQARYDAGYATREAEYAAARQKQADQQIKDAEKREVRNNELVADLGQKLDAIAARPAGKPVWMCPPPARVPAAPGPATADSTASAHEAEAGKPAGAVRDIGPGTRAILDDGDAGLEELATLQAWVVRECLRPPSTN